MVKRNLLVLDLDETLIFATEDTLGFPADHNIFGYHIYQRPFLVKFLDQCFEMFDVAVWSSASDDYVAQVVEVIFPKPDQLKFVWGRSRATLPRFVDPYSEWPIDHRHYVKHLSKVAAKGWPLENILIVDDTPEKSARNYGNAIYPSPFEGDRNDSELVLLGKYLAVLQDCENVRKVEKRDWRSRARKL